MRFALSLNTRWHQDEKAKEKTAHSITGEHILYETKSDELRCHRAVNLMRIIVVAAAVGVIPYNAAQERVELDQTRARSIEVENRCRFLESTLAQKEQDVRALQEVLLESERETYTTTH